jgi:hypothetical protein
MYQVVILRVAGRSAAFSGGLARVLSYEVLSLPSGELSLGSFELFTICKFLLDFALCHYFITCSVSSTIVKNCSYRYFI